MGGQGADRVQKMTAKKHILVLNGSASAQSSNERLIERFRRAMAVDDDVRIWPALKSIPHFDPELSVGDDDLHGQAGGDYNCVGQWTEGA
jgi:hypothetical protein